MRVTATEAKNRFGAICAEAKSGPIFVEKDGRVDTVILSAGMFEKLQDAVRSGEDARRSADFSRRYAAWIAEQNERVEKLGLWCDDLRVW